MPSSGLTQHSCFPFLYPTALTTRCPLEKAFTGAGVQHPLPNSHLPWAAAALAIWWWWVGGLSGHRPLCAQPSLAAWYEAQLLPDPHPEGRGEALEGLGLGALNSSSLSSVPPLRCWQQLLGWAGAPGTGCWGAGEGGPDWDPLAAALPSVLLCQA